MTLQLVRPPRRGLDVWEESLLAFRRNLADVRARWIQGDVEDLPEIVSAADRFLHAIARTPPDETGSDVGESESECLLRAARQGARREVMARLTRDTLREVEVLLDEFRASQNAIRAELTSPDPGSSGTPRRLDRMA